MRQLSGRFMWILALRSCLGMVILSLLLPALNAAEEAPNFVIFIADDMAWEDCGAYGNKNIRTPNIDGLARDGMRFDRAYLTCSSCSPSRCSILTGRYPHATGAPELHNALPASATMFTLPLRKGGYWTAAVGKWHLGEAVTEQVDYRSGSRPAGMGKAWVKALQERPKGKPFFLWAAHSDPHRGYQPGAVDPPHKREDVVVPPFFPDVPDVRDDLALYYDEVSRFDEHVGMVLEELKHQEVAQNTFVLVMSDNGRPFPHCKTRVHVPGVRTPFVVRWPAGLSAGQSSMSVVSSVDIAPTILELAGLPGLDAFQGKSFAGLFTNPKKEIRPFAFAEHNWHDYRAFERAVHSQRYCYVKNWLPNVPGTPPADAVRSPTFRVMQELRQRGELKPEHLGCFDTPRPTEFLYDVVNDPHCIHNLAYDPAFNPSLKRLRSALENWQKQTDDHFPGEDVLTPDGFDRDSGQRLKKTSIDRK